MKKEFLIILFIGIISFAQDTPGNLQFNRVVNFSETVTIYTGSSSGGFPSENKYTTITPITVPDGKVLKITSLTVAKYYELGTIKELNECGQCAASIGGVTAFTHQTSGYTTNNKLFPLWFNSGEKEFLVFNPNGGKVIVSFTGIEFNIVN
jgi:hypothetical protein